ncbi:MAG: hypothetical protein BWZ08_00423 [candidate division BRC1 bacterium ADurb.BinA292]|nr:MAG: hypothetical protein BWZ08_00423 [candidate division BRC1 bacterium ADurb.BinA292]
MFGWLNQFWMNWLLAGRRAEARDGGAGRWELDTVGRYRFSSLLFMGLWVVLAAGVTLDAWLRPEDATRRREEAAAWFSLFVVPLAMALFGIVDAWWARVTIEPAGLRFQYPWRPGALVRWEDIVQIRHRESFHWFTIRRRGGAAIRAAMSIRCAGPPPPRASPGSMPTTGWAGPRPKPERGRGSNCEAIPIPIAIPRLISGAAVVRVDVERAVHVLARVAGTEDADKAVNGPDENAAHAEQHENPAAEGHGTTSSRACSSTRRRSIRWRVSAIMMTKKRISRPM